MRLYVPLILVCALGIIYASCKRSTPPPPPKSADTLVVIVGGLGRSQLGEIADAIRKNPRCIVVDAGLWNGYKTPILPIIDAYPAPRRVLVLHSYAAWWVTQPLPHFDYVAIIEPVNPGGDGFAWWSSTLPSPSFSDHTEVFYRTEHDIVRTATIEGITPIKVPNTNHNSICHDAGLIDHVTREIAKL